MRIDNPRQGYIPVPYYHERRLRMRKMKFVRLFSILILCSCTTFKAMNVVDTLPKDQPKGYVSFFSDYSYFNPNGKVDVYRTDGGQEVFEGTTYDPFGSVSGVVEELRIAETPGSHDFRISTPQGSDPEQVMWTGTIQIRENSITYVGLHELLLGSGSTPGNQYSSGSWGYSYYVIVSAGSTPIPASPDPVTDSALLTRALADRDWATRKLAIRALSRAKDAPADSILETVRSLAANDRYAGVRKEANAYLKSRGMPEVLQPLYLDTFAINMGWPLMPQGANRDTMLDFDRDGYHMETKTSYVVAVPMEYLMSGIGFFGYDPDNLKNFTVELDCAWEKGIVDNGYGLVLGKDYQNCYAFIISKNGGAMVSMFADNSFVNAPLPWSQAASSTIQDRPASRIKVKVAADRAEFVVNDVSIGTFAIDRSYLSRRIGMCVFGAMGVRFDRLSISEDK
jgi:hypothetical protein